MLHLQRQVERADWIEKMSRLTLLPPQLSSAAPIFFPFLRQFLFFYREPLSVNGEVDHAMDGRQPVDDRPHLWRMLNLILASSRSTGMYKFVSVEKSHFLIRMGAYRSSQFLRSSFCERRQNYTTRLVTPRYKFGFGLSPSSHRWVR